MVDKIRGLEYTFSISPSIEPIPIVVYDFMVLAHNLVHSSRGVPDDLLADWYKASWAVLLNRGPVMLEEFPFIPIVVNDWKVNGAYWRTLEFADYKRNRTKTDEVANYLAACTKAGVDYCKEAGIEIYREQLFEADDWAGAIARSKRNSQPGSLLKERYLFLYSVDSDWTQLVDDANKILFACSSDFHPLLRGEKEVLAHIKRTMDVDLKHPSQLAYFKSLKGDRSDNLPAGSCISLFDLIAENKRWSLESQASQWAELLDRISHENEDGRKLDHLKKSLIWLLKNGLPLPCTM